MINPELLQSIRTQLGNGASKESVRQTLLAGGQSAERVDEGFRSIEENAFDRVFFGNRLSYSAQEGAIQKKVRPSFRLPALHLPSANARVWYGGMFLVLVALLGGFWYWYLGAPTRLTREIRDAQQSISSYETTVTTQNVGETTETMRAVIGVDYQKGLTDATITIPNIAKSRIIFDGKEYYAKISLEDSGLRDMLSLPTEWMIYEPDDVALIGKDIFDRTREWSSARIFADENCARPEERALVERSTWYVSCTLVANGSTTVAHEFWFDRSTYLPIQQKTVVDGVIFLQQISKINYALAITVPENALSRSEWKKKQFLDGLPKERIVEVAFYRGKGVSKEEEATAEQAVRDYYGVRTVTFKEDAGEIPKQAPLYNEDRKQYDADILWDSVAKNMNPLGLTRRIIYLTNVDTYSSVSPERPYVFSRALPGVNTVFISLSSFKTTPPATGSTTPDLINARISKAVVRALGVSVGIAYSDDAERKECVMYQATTTPELDEVGMSMCPVAETAIPLVFLSASTTPSTR